MRKSNCLAMILAGGRGSRLGVLTKDQAKPGLLFGGKYRIIDFPLSNCRNSGINTVGILTQYQPLELTGTSATAARGTWIPIGAVHISCRRMKATAVPTGTAARPTLFIRT